MKQNLLACVYSEVIIKIPFFLGKDVELIFNYIKYLNIEYLDAK